MIPTWELQERGLFDIATIVRQRKREERRRKDRLSIRIEQVYALTGSCAATMAVIGCTYHEVYDALRRMEAA